MDIVYVVLIIFLSVRNSAKAKLKGQNPLLWGFMTLFASFVAFIIGEMVVVFAFCRDQFNIELFSSGDPKSRALATQQLADAINSNFLHSSTIELFGLGGYLLIRYVLDSKPDKKKPEVHWMDKMGEQKSENH